MSDLAAFVEQLKNASVADVQSALAALSIEDRTKVQAALAGGVKVHGVPPSANCVGPILLAMDLGVGGLEFCNIMEGAQMKPEFLALNPFHHVPTLQDGDLAIGESVACLRYLANKYRPAYYPTSDPVTCAWIDFAMDAFGSYVYKPWAAVVYGCLGFAAVPEDGPAAATTAKEAVDKWAANFLKGKFVCGDSLSIADFKAGPFLFAATLPGVEKAGLVMSDRVKQYAEDFCAATAASGFMKSAGGFALAEVMASKAPDAPAAAAFTKPEIAGKPAFGATSGKVQIYGMPPSFNCAGPTVLAMDAGVGGLEMCNLMEGAHKTPEFAAMNPFTQVPTLKDGEFAIGESLAVLRYIALKYKPEYYPVADAKACATIDFACEAFSTELYPKFVPVVYPVCGFAGPTADQAKANKELEDAAATYTSLFLKGKFVGGDKLTIADFKIAPFFFAMTQPGIEKKTGFKPSERVTQYAADFTAAVASSAFMKEAGGFAIAEYIASKSAE